jgi:hypothetical protein
MVNQLMVKKVEDTKRVIRNRKSKKERQYNGQKKKDQKDKQGSTNYYIKTNDRGTRTSLKTGSELKCVLSGELT